MSIAFKFLLTFAILLLIFDWLTGIAKTEPVSPASIVNAFALCWAIAALGVVGSLITLVWQA